MRINRRSVSVQKWSWTGIQASFHECTRNVGTSRTLENSVEQAAQVERNTGPHYVFRPVISWLSSLILLVYCKTRLLIDFYRPLWPRNCGQMHERAGVCAFDFEQSTTLFSAATFSAGFYRSRYTRLNVTVLCFFVGYANRGITYTRNFENKFSEVVNN